MTIAFIPVRGGSKSIPSKNIKLFCGKPLVYWCAKAADIPSIDRIVIATDSISIIDTVTQFNIPKIETYRRDPSNAQDHSSTESVMIEFLKNENISSEATFILIQATSPLLESSHLENGISLYLEKQYDSILSCTVHKRFLWNPDGSTINYEWNNRPRRQDFKGVLQENGAFYINSVKNILLTHNRLHGNIGMATMPEHTAVEIDEEDDWIIAEHLMRKHVLPSKESHEIKLFISDVDGVLTDSGMYYGDESIEMKKFNTRDGKGFQLLREHGIKTAIITGEITPMVDRRAAKLNIDFLYQGINNKVAIAKEICNDLNIELKNVAFIGDDINDTDLLSKVGLSATPADGMETNKNIVDFITSTKGGEGCVREFAESILSLNQKTRT